MAKGQALVRVGTAYVVALGAGATWLYLGPDTAELWLDTLLADVLATLVIFGFSRGYGNSSFYDAYWSVVPPLVAAYWWAEAGADSSRLRDALVLALIVLWAVRLTANWVSTFPGLHHEDWRYPMLREKAGRWEAAVDLVGIHLVPTLQVFLGLLPVYVVITRSTRAAGWLDAAALVIGIGAVTLETVADRQMHRFAHDQPPGQVMDRGLWAWSRHPNYLGELGFWFALALFGVAASPADARWLFVGFASMLAMFEAASIPMMEQRSLERRPAYADVVARVPRLFPRPPRHGRIRTAPDRPG